jgi:hypothetical protein
MKEIKRRPIGFPQPSNKARSSRQPITEHSLQLIKESKDNPKDSSQKDTSTLPVEQSTIFNRFKFSIEKTIERAEKEALESEPGYFDKEFSDYIKDKARYKTIRKILSELDDLVRFVKKLKYSGEWNPPKWLLKARVKIGGRSVSIWDRLKRTRFANVYGYLVKNRLRQEKQTYKIINNAGGSSWGDKYPDEYGACEDVIVMPDIDKMSTDLGMSKDSIQKYLREFSRAGILKRLPNKIERGGRIVYGIGIRKGWKNPKTGKSGQKIHYYLKESDKIKEALYKFRISPHPDPTL